MGDFHYGEMEMHRLGMPLRGWGSWSWFYWLLNGYGERPLKALFCLTGFFLFFSWLIWFLGLTVASCRNDATFLETMRFVIEKAMFQRPEWAKPVTELGQWIANSIVPVIPGQLALFFLALRNRLGRRR